MNIMDSLRKSISKDLSEAAEELGFGTSDSGLSVPKPTSTLYPTGDFSWAVDKEIVDAMSTRYHRAVADNMAAVKLLVDAEGELLCAVVCKAGGGTSYYYDKDEDAKILPSCSPITIIDLAMLLVQLQKSRTVITWGGLTADFRMMFSKGLAVDEWAYIAANHIDMLYQLRLLAGSRINLQLACLSMGITAVEQGAQSFKIEEATNKWKSGEVKNKIEVMDSMRAYCKLLLCLYGAVEENHGFSYKPRDEKGRGQIGGDVDLTMSWDKVWSVYDKHWIKGNLEKEATSNENFATINVMHNWLVGFAEKAKKTLQQLVPPTDSLSGLLGRGQTTG